MEIDWDKQLASVTAAKLGPRDQIIFEPGTSWQSRWRDLLSLAFPTAEIVDIERLGAKVGSIYLLPMLATTELVGARLIYRNKHYYGETVRTVQFAKGKASLARLKAALSQLQVLDGESLLEQAKQQAEREYWQSIAGMVGPVPEGMTIRPSYGRSGDFSIELNVTGQDLFVRLARAIRDLVERAKEPQP